MSSYMYPPCLGEGAPQPAHCLLSVVPVLVGDSNE